jgi:hypothetical protein
MAGSEGLQEEYSEFYTGGGKNSERRKDEG